MKLLAALLVSTTACSSLGLGSSSQASSCPDSPAAELFSDTVCICEDFTDIGNLIVGRAIEDDQPVLAVNGLTKFFNNADIRGDFVAYGGMDAKANVEVEGSYSSAADVSVLGNFESDRDMEIGGNLGGIGRLYVGGTLRVAGANSFIGDREIKAEGNYSNTPEPPCGCDPADIFDVRGAVAAASASNDNAAAGLSTSLSNIGFSDLRLGSGEYYFSDAANIGFTRITVDGAVALYVDGDIDNIGAEQIRLTDGSTLDLYVSRNVRNVGHVSLGDKRAPSSFRLYIGGGDECTLSVGNALFNGAIYAPQARLHYIGNTKIRGAVFAREITGTGNLIVGYAAPQPPPAQCPEPEPNPDPEPQPDPPEEEDPPVVL